MDWLRSQRAGSVSNVRFARCLIGNEREILALTGWCFAVFFRVDARDAGERLVQVCHVRAKFPFQPFCAR